MIEIACITLQNEMDLVLANRRAMKLAELAGFTLSNQTTFATAVSEVSRASIERSKTSRLYLCVDSEVAKDKYIVAKIEDPVYKFDNTAVFDHARKLADKFIISTDNHFSVELHFYIAASNKITAVQIEGWKSHFNHEPPFSPYEEIKRKNEQLLEVTEKLVESENQFKTLTNTLPILIFSLDMQRKIVYANDWMLSYTGTTLDVLNAEQWRNVIHPEDIANCSILFNQSPTHGNDAVTMEARIKDALGNYAWHLISLSPVIGNKDILLYWIGFLVNINAQKLVEKTLKENKELEDAQQLLHKKQEGMRMSIEELNRSNTELSQFAFIASHDLQEPLRKIILYSDYLVNKYADVVDEKGMTYLQHMISASYRMRDLVEDLLSFSMVNSQQLKMQNVDLNVLCNDVIQDMEVTVKEKEGIFTIAALPVINGDYNLMRQLFLNIISNSLKYAKASIPPAIDITSTQDEQEVTIRVADNGIGFEEKYMEKVFTLFQRLHDKGTYKGTGLGLAICRKIVQLHNGSIRAVSEPGVGSTFIITLPLH